MGIVLFYKKVIAHFQDVHRVNQAFAAQRRLSAKAADAMKSWRSPGFWKQKHA